MTTLMQWGNSDGIKGRCDDKCHSATEPKCDCMCGGRFHGAANKKGGLEEAIQEYQKDVVDYANKRLMEEGYIMQINNIRQFVEMIEGREAQCKLL